MSLNGISEGDIEVSKGGSLIVGGIVRGTIINNGGSVNIAGIASTVIANKGATTISGVVSSVTGNGNVTYHHGAVIGGIPIEQE